VKRRSIEDWRKEGGGYGWKSVSSLSNSNSNSNSNSEKETNDDNILFIKIFLIHKFEIS